MQNIEIKTPLPDPAATESRLAAVDARFVWERLQIDTFFNVPSGYLKLRAVRGEPGELIAYVRAPGTEPRPSDYDIAPVEDTAALETALRRSLGVRGVVEKTRRLYLWRHTRVHIDRVTGLGAYLELEAVAREIPLEEARAQADAMIRLLDLDPAEFLDRPYLELLEGCSARVTD